MSKREAQQRVREHGGVPVERPEAGVDWIVVGEAELPMDDLTELLGDGARQAAERGELTVLTETQLWQRLGFVEGEQSIHRLYTPAMLANLAGVPVAVVRRWQRRGLIVPAREVRRLAYFDFQEVATARRLADLLAAGISPQAIEKKLAAVSRLLPGVARPLAQLSVIVEGKELLLRQGDGLIEPGGQFRFDFENGSPEGSRPGEPSVALPLTRPYGDPRAVAPRPAGPTELREMAAALEDDGELESAAETYRAALAAGGSNAEVCFLLAELLYRLGDVTAARERYYMAIELDEDYVEARANLGCVLAELGQHELAAAAFEGALAFHHDYPDAHYHLARTLDELGRRDDAEPHWRAFVERAGDSPWAHAARERLAGKRERSEKNDLR
ncbi:MAG TPA: MerR family transcriptional regulator [Pirellulales bacterium]|nr:MerR family transcriptional regulator [Pirellulales bacterium]